VGEWVANIHVIVIRQAYLTLKTLTLTDVMQTSLNGCWPVLNLIFSLHRKGWMLTWIKFDDIWVCLFSYIFSLCWQYSWMTIPHEPCWLLAV
jgi:hypothetical protein